MYVLVQPFLHSTSVSDQHTDTQTTLRATSVEICLKLESTQLFTNYNTNSVYY